VSAAWARLVNSNGSDEHLDLCNEALKDVQEEAERRVLRGLLASLEEVRAQRQAAVGLPGYRMTALNMQARGEVVGLTVAINAIKRRLK